jgi:hypothetical protein
LLRLENFALRHQLAVYQQTVARPRLRRTDHCSGRDFRGSGLAGMPPWHSSSPVP